jgi:hypothetical protein
MRTQVHFNKLMALMLLAPGKVVNPMMVMMFVQA